MLASTPGYGTPPPAGNGPASGSPGPPGQGTHAQDSRSGITGRRVYPQAVGHLFISKCVILWELQQHNPTCVIRNLEEKETVHITCNSLRIPGYG